MPVPGATAGRGTVNRAACLAAVRAYVAECVGADRHPGLVDYERLARVRGWPARSTISLRLGRWVEALAAVGYGPGSDQDIRRRRCIAAVGAHIAEMIAAGRQPTSASYGQVSRRRGWPSPGVVRKALGDWRAAMTAAGSVAPEPSRGYRIGPATCRAALSLYVAECRRQSLYPSVTLYESRSRRQGWPTRETIVARLGSWAAALDAAGFSDARPAHDRVTVPACVEAVRAYLDECVEAATAPSAAGYGLVAGSRGWPARSTVSRRLASWDQAVAAARLLPGRPARPEPGPSLTAGTGVVRANKAVPQPQGTRPLPSTRRPGTLAERGRT